LNAEPGPADFGKLLKPTHAGFTAIDESCQSCHQGHRFHQPNVVEDHSCSACHREHLGRGTLRQPEDANCDACHANKAIMMMSLKKGKELPPAAFDYRPDLGRVLFKASRPEQGYTEIITAFAKDHPEFQVIRDKLKDPDTLKFNHQLHLTSPNIPLVKGQKLECASCHIPDATGAYYQAVSFKENCQTCHSLQFDERNPELTLPHGNPEFARAFLRSLPEQYADYARAKKGLTRQGDVDLFVRQQMREWGTRVNSINELEKQIFLSDAHTGLSQKLNGTEVTARARFPGCAYCHEVKSGAGDLPAVTSPVLFNRWLIRGRFDHSRHTVASSSGRGAHLACSKCHEVTQSHDTSDVLLPSQTTCVKCHSPEGGVANNCSTCHSYHAPPGSIALTTAAPK